MPERQKRVISLDENTKIPLGLAWVVGIALVSIAMSFATILVKQDNVQAHVLTIDGEIDGINRERVQQRDQVIERLNDLHVDIELIKQKLNVRKQDAGDSRAE